MADEKEKLPFTPCIGVCELDEAGEYCTGCWRTVEEITRWYGMSHEEKARVYQQLEKRRQLFDRADGERTANERGE